MKTVRLENRVVNTIVDMLRNFKQEVKLDLIIKLSEAAKKDEAKKQSDFKKTFGAWDSAESAEDLEKMIYSSRVFDRNIESL